MKRLELNISHCSGCPYLRYDPNYGISYDSGYDCNKNGNRIIDDYELTTKREKDENYKIEIPNWCPLPSVGGCHDWAD